MLGAFDAGDSLSGDADTDALVLKGDYSGGVTLTDTTISGMERMLLRGNFDYDLTMADGNVAAGESLRVSAAHLGAGHHLTFDGSLEQDGSFFVSGAAGANTITGGGAADVIRGGAAGDTLTGGGGADRLHGEGGGDTFVYNGAADSTGTSHDIITGFDASADRFHLAGISVNAIDAAIVSGRLGGNFDGNLAAVADASRLFAYDAVLFTPDKGSYAGHTFLIVDANGTAGYQAGQDLVIDLTGATHLDQLTTASFI